MQISVDPGGTLQVASKTDQALADLEAIFDTCDAATDAVAAILANGAPAVAASVRDLAAREGGHRTKAFAQAHAANGSLRDAVGDFVRFGEKTVEELDQMRRDAEQLIESGLDKIKQGVAEVREFGEGVVENVQEFGEDVVENVQEFGEGVVENVQDLGETVVDGVHDAVDAVTDWAKRGPFSL